MHAAKYSNLNIVKFLVQSGASIDEIDDLGYNVADWAAQNKDIEVLRYFESLGIKQTDFLGGYYE
ncbi:ankyrin repeat domain-containing protein [Campylobacter ureolyticus]|nr:ankyrin repeat domain-containing protein [Campylobacter ureolyticus]